MAVTRAQALLIVVGDPDVLSIDPMWRGFLNYVYQNYGWIGDDPGWNTKEAVLEDENYAAAYRDAAAMGMAELMERLLRQRSG